MKANEQGRQADWIFVAILIIAVPLLFVILYNINSDTRTKDIQTILKDTSGTDVKKNTNTIKADSIKPDTK